MNSGPFYENNNCFSMFLESILDSYSQTYLQVITLSSMPSGPLASMVKMIHLPKVSPFIVTNYNEGQYNNCLYVLTRYPMFSCKNTSNYMFSHDIPAIFSYLTTNGYIIDKDISKIINNSHISIISTTSGSNRRFICFVSYKIDS
jgi:hypothetical protein